MALRDRVMKASWERNFISKRTSPENILEFVKISRDPEMDKAVIRSFIQRTTSKKDIIKVLAGCKKLYSSEKHLRELDELSAESFEKYLSLKPSTKEIIEFREKTTGYMGSHCRITKTALEKAKSPEEFIKLSKISHSNPSQSLIEWQSKAVGEKLEKFAALKPSAAQIRQLKVLLPTLSANISSAIENRNSAACRGGLRQFLLNALKKLQKEQK